MTLIKEVILKPRFSTEDINSSAAQVTAALKPVNELGKEIETTFKEAFDPKNIETSQQRIFRLTKTMLELKVAGKQNSKEFKEIAAEIRKIDESDAIGKVVKKSTSLKGELRKIKEELAGMSDVGSPEFEKLSIRAAKLEDSIGDVNERVKVLASDTFKFDAAVGGIRALTAGFAVAQGAAALFGDESEEVQKALLKVQAATGLLIGVQELSNIATGQGAFKLALLSAAQKVQTFVTTGATVALRAFNAALIATGIGAVIAGIALLVTYWEDIAKFTGIATGNLKDAKKAEEDLAELVKKRKDEIEDFAKTYKGVIGQARLELELAEKRKASEKEIISLKVFLNIAEQEKVKFAIQNKLLSEDALANEKIKLRFLEAELEGLRKIAAVAPRTRQTPIDIEGIGEDYLKTLTLANKNIGKDLVDTLKKLDVPTLVIPIEIQEAIENMRFIQQELPGMIVDGLGNVADTIFQVTLNRQQQEFDSEVANLERIKDARIANENITADEKQIIEAQYQANVSKLREKQFKREQQAAVSQALLNGALAVTNLAVKTIPGTPAFFAGLALIGTTILSQIAVIKSTPPPAFKDGVIDFKGKGTGTSDSNLVRMSRGESVMTAKETSENYDALMAIRRGQFNKFLNQKGFETQRLSKPVGQKEKRRTNIKSRGREKIIIENYGQIANSLASKLNKAAYTKRT